MPHLWQPGTPAGKFERASSGPSFGLLKALARHSAIYGLFDLAGRAGAFLLVPLYTTSLGPAAYGYLELYTVTQALLVILATLGFHSALTKYYILAEDPKDRDRFFNTALGAVLVWGAGLVLVLGLSAPVLVSLFPPGVRDLALWRLVLGTVVLDSGTVIGLSLLRSQERPARYSVVALTKLLVTLTASILLVGGLGWGIRGAVLGALAGAVAGALAALGLIRPVRPRIDPEALRSLAQLGVPLVAGGLLLYLMSNMDRYFLGRLALPEDLGLYALGNRVALIMSLALNAFLAAWPPILFQITRSTRSAETMGRVLTYYLIATCGVLLVLAAFGREIVALLAPPEFRSASRIVVVLSASHIFLGLYYFFTAGAVLQDRTRSLPGIILAACGVQFGLSFLLIPAQGALGAALSRLIAFGLLAGIMVRIGQRDFPIPIETPRLGRLAAITLGLLAGLAALDLLPPGAAVPGKTVLVVLYPLALLLARVVDADERRRLETLVRRRLGVAV